VLRIAFRRHNLTARERSLTKESLGSNAIVGLRWPTAVVWKLMTAGSLETTSSWTQSASCGSQADCDRLRKLLGPSQSRLERDRRLVGADYGVGNSRLFRGSSSRQALEICHRQVSKRAPATTLFNKSWVTGTEQWSRAHRESAARWQPSERGAFASWPGNLARRSDHRRPRLTEHQDGDRAMG
jgi:hypothetical protein